MHSTTPSGYKAAICRYQAAKARIRTGQPRAKAICSLPYGYARPSQVNWLLTSADASHVAAIFQDKASIYERRGCRYRWLETHDDCSTFCAAEPGAPQQYFAWGCGPSRDVFASPSCMSGDYFIRLTSVSHEAVCPAPLYTLSARVAAIVCAGQGSATAVTMADKVWVLVQQGDSWVQMCFELPDVHEATLVSGVLTEGILLHQPGGSASP